MSAGAGVSPALRLKRSLPRRTWLISISCLVAAALLLPLVFLIIEARQAGGSELHRILFRELSLRLLTNTVQLAVVVTLCTASLGVGAAWVIERTALPLRKMWAVLIVLPASIPDFVAGYAWHSISPTFKGLWAATLVMSLALYPLVYLPVAAALRRVDPALEETSRSLGHGSWSTFRRVVLPQISPALIGGSLVVMLALLAEFGAFEIVGFQTFTTTIFSEFKVSPPAASALALVLVGLGMLVLGGEGLLRGGGRINRTGAISARAQSRRPLGWMLIPTLLLLTALIALSVGVPLGTVLYWLTHTQHSTLPASATLLSATLATIRFAAAAAFIATLAALPVALYANTSRTRFARVLERSTLLIQSIPGVVVGLTLVFFGVHYAIRFYQTSAMLVLAYALLFFPLALVCLRASVAQAPPRLTEMGRSLGRSPLRVLMTVTVPLILPGLASAFCLVFLSASAELTATLLLVPTEVHTLATQFWAYQSSAAYGAAAPYAAMIVLVAAVPSVILGTFFSRSTGAISPIGER